MNVTISQIPASRSFMHIFLDNKAKDPRGNNEYPGPISWMILIMHKFTESVGENTEWII